MKVKITKAYLDSYWYSKHIGEEFEVVKIVGQFKLLDRNWYIYEQDCVVVQETITKPPPLGLRPEFIVLEHRQKEIQEAVTRYMEAGLAIPSAWTAEYYRNNSRLLEIK